MKKLALFVRDLLAVLIGLVLAVIAIVMVWIFFAIVIPIGLVLIAVAGVWLTFRFINGLDSEDPHW